MGWLRTILLGNIGNRLDIEDSEREIARLKQTVHSFEKRGAASIDRVDALVAENAELKLHLVAVLRLLIKKGVISKEEIETMSDEVERQDGKTDGRYFGPIV